MIIKLSKLDLEISVTEITGSSLNPDHSHFVEDRNKIAKNLKIILNFIHKTYSGNFQLFHKIKVYGVQIYIYHYLSMNLWKLQEIIFSSAENITLYIEEVGKSSNSDSDNIDPVKPLPKKQRKKMIQSL
ncbi:27928_t:CDS:2 [Dentiscutata erythropus]|uniref:27928_t:CDS:1 n=1 Tax=Dentiscutata erythropus TaxID=1348616 RepID=A0A9N9GNJ5_9GLOM|nr:27928_t:CDS:2 [Dentiscutata erythropus]